MPAQLRGIVIDDEPITLEVIEAHVGKVPFLELRQTFVNAVEVPAFLKTGLIGLIFPDINMPDLAGLNFAQVVGNQSLMIFTTAYSECGLQGFELSVPDYLLKPIASGR